MTAEAQRQPPAQAREFLLDSLLGHVVEREGSDLHLSEGSPPILRVHGRLEPLGNGKLSESNMRSALSQLLLPQQLERFDQVSDIDFSYKLGETARFRGNAFRQNRGLSIVLRQVPVRIPKFDELGLPDSVRQLAELQRGMVLFTGPAGVGKSTTLAALIDLINETRADHIVTIEDPIEFVHQNKKALVNQREVGVHTESFASALRASLREDPDVILVGEMRDPETISIGLTAAETGHLVLGTMHTTSAHKTIDRIIDSFPGDQQGQVRSMVAESLHAVVSQQLLRRRDGKGRVLAFEIMLNTPAISNLIREGKTFQIPQNIQASGRKTGMVLMDQSIRDLLESGSVDVKEALMHVQDRRSLSENNGLLRPS